MAVHLRCQGHWAVALLATETAEPVLDAASQVAAHPAAPQNGGMSEPTGDRDLHGRLSRLEHQLSAEARGIGAAGERIVVPAWRRVTDGEPRWPVTLVVLGAIAMQVALPPGVATRPSWLLPALATLLLIGVLIANPRRVDRESPALRAATLVLVGVLSLANAWSAARLIDQLLRGANHQQPTALLLTGGTIWLTNIIVFSLWYWELDRGGPVARAHHPALFPDFVFPQMQSPELAPPTWEPGFVDYLYLSFTNAAAFSPTDVMPLSRWAKLTMLVQSMVSLATLALVIARAVNVLK